MRRSVLRKVSDGFHLLTRVEGWILAELSYRHLTRVEAPWSEREEKESAHDNQYENNRENGNSGSVLGGLLAHSSMPRIRPISLTRALQSTLSNGKSVLDECHGML